MLVFCRKPATKHAVSRRHLKTNKKILKIFLFVFNNYVIFDGFLLDLSFVAGLILLSHAAKRGKRAVSCHCH